jgi:hypothetical protein
VAKINFGAGIADARGSVGGHTFSKNQFGAYLRQKVSPVQPRSPEQTLVRQMFGDLAKRWFQVLDSAQRAAWIALAASNPVVDVFGNSQILSGLQLYMRCNRNLQSVGVTVIDDAPADQGVVNFGSLSIAASVGGGTIALTFTPDPTGADTYFVVFATPLLSPGKAFTNSFMRQITSRGVNEGSPTSIFNEWVAKYGALALGQRLGVKLSMVNSLNGAASPFLFADTLVVA